MTVQHGIPASREAEDCKFEAQPGQFSDTLSNAKWDWGRSSRHSVFLTVHRPGFHPQDYRCGSAVNPLNSGATPPVSQDPSVVS